MELTIKKIATKTAYKIHANLNLKNVATKAKFVLDESESKIAAKEN